MIPEHTKNCIDRYVAHGFHPGDFVYYVLTNNLQMSFGFADINNRHHMFDIVCYVHNKLPYNCHGSVDRVQHYMSCFDSNGIMIHEPKG